MLLALTWKILFLITATFFSTAWQGFASSISLGQKLYLELCAKCHGEEGKGANAPPLFHFESFEKFRKAVENGVEPWMPSFKLSKTEIREIFNFLASKNLPQFSPSSVFYVNVVPVFKPHITVAVEKGRGFWVFQGERPVTFVSFPEVHGGVKFSSNAFWVFSRKGDVMRYPFESSKAISRKICLWINGIETYRDFLVVSCRFPKVILVLDENLEEVSSISTFGKAQLFVWREGFGFVEDGKIFLVEFDRGEGGKMRKTTGKAKKSSKKKLCNSISRKTRFKLKKTQIFPQQKSDKAKISRNLKIKLLCHPKFLNLLIFSYENRIFIFDVGRGWVVFSFPVELETKPHLSLCTFWVSRDDKLKVVIPYGRFAFFISPFERKILKVFEGDNFLFAKTFPTTNYVFLLDGRKILVINRETLEVSFELEGIHLDFSSCGKMIFLSTRDGLKILDSKTLGVIRKFEKIKVLGKYSFIPKAFEEGVLGWYVWRAKCWGCHHITREAFGPPLISFTKYSIRRQVKSPLKNMPKIKLDDWEIKALQSFLDVAKMCFGDKGGER